VPPSSPLHHRRQAKLVVLNFVLLDKWEVVLRSQRISVASLWWPLSLGLYEEASRLLRRRALDGDVSNVEEDGLVSHLAVTGLASGGGSADVQPLRRNMEYMVARQR
jgi:hypothetical protein